MPFIKKLVLKGFKSFPRETTILLDRTMNCIVGPNGSGKSSSYDTLVTLSNGEEIEIGKLVEEKIKKLGNIKELSDGIYVDGNNDIEIISLNKKTMKSEKKKVSKFIKRNGEILYKIKTRTGKEVKATGCHPVMTFKHGEIKSILISDLKKGNLVATPRKIEILEKEEHDPELARLIGYIIGDGYIAKDRIEFVNGDKEIIEDFKNLINKFSEGEFRERYEKNATRLYIRDKKFVKKTRDFFDKNSVSSITSKNKKIPSFLLNTDKESISNLLAGLYDTDGSIRKDLGIIEFCTKNKELANQIQGLLLRFGILSKIKKRICCASNTEAKTKRGYYYIFIYGIENLKNFYINIPLKVKHKKDNLKLHVSKTTIPNPNIDILPQEINLYIKELANLLGIRIKPLRKQYPAFVAYIENRCLPTRQGISKILPLFNKKLSILESFSKNLGHNQSNLVDCMNNLNISGQEASKQIGLHQQVIKRDWATNRFNAKPENLGKFYNLINNTFIIRISRIKELLSLLTNLVNSDIYWDEIISIEKIDKEPYVYDLTIEGNHNFIANNIFIHNSNITDAICFVLGRLSIKSMRAAKAAHLIFAGTKLHKPLAEASVEMIFDNSDKTFSLQEQEVSLKRIVRSGGQSIYKINNSVKTRQEVLELLAQAGIDPHGFNIVLQGEIDSFVKMHGEERRKIIEEVAGISVYETRKQKSLRELDKTEEKMKQVSAVLQERTSYLRNLEQERQQALRFKKLEETVKRCKASMLKKKLDDKSKEKSKTDEEIHKKNSSLDKLKIIMGKTQEEINNYNEKINEINNKIQKSSGFEQGSLNREIAESKAEITGLSVRKENYQSQIEEIERRKEELEKNIKNSETEISEMRKTKGKSRKQDLENKRTELDSLEDKRRKLYSLKSSFNFVNERKDDKKKQLQRIEQESNFLLERIEELEKTLKFKDSIEKNKSLMLSLKKILEEKIKQQQNNEKTILDAEKEIAASEMQIQELEDIKKKVAELDVCPLCKTKITEKHVGHIEKEADEKISSLKEKILSSKKRKNKSWDIKENLLIEIRKIEEEADAREKDTVKLESIQEKKQNIKRLEDDKNRVLDELKQIDSKTKNLEKTISQFKNLEQGYDSLRLEVQELERHEEVDVGMEITMKQRELDRMKLIIKQISREKQELEEEISDISQQLEEKESEVLEREKQEQMLQEKFRKMISEKNKFQDKIRLFESDLLKKQNDSRLLENDINNFKIKMAELNAQIEALGLEFKEFKGVAVLKLTVEQLQERLQKTQTILSTIGSVNLRALEVYDNMKKEYDQIALKIEQLQKEKLEILKIIDEIDNKKKKAFNKTLTEINSLFSRNFSQLSTKGDAFLEPENKEDVFSGGLDIIIRVSRGKYFDVTSLSGGEQTLIALSLIFAIQEFRPYCFYIFDEIDAALDKRNSERLALLLKKYMKAGQYIMITHNDALISEATTLYGVSMQEGISKILSLQI